MQQGGAGHGVGGRWGWRRRGGRVLVVDAVGEGLQQGRLGGGGVRRCSSGLVPRVIGGGGSWRCWWGGWRRWWCRRRHSALGATVGSEGGWPHWCRGTLSLLLGGEQRPLAAERGALRLRLGRVEV